MPPSTNNTWLRRYALLTAVATLGLIGIGGLVTSHGVGMAVPDWPTTYGYNMFFFPISKWVGGIFYEHTHRLAATAVGVLVVGLTRWLGGSPSRIPLAIIGFAELAAGFGLLFLGAQWKGAGYFLSGIGGVVLIAGAVWARNEPAEGLLPRLGWLVFGLVQLQGLLGGLRVVLFKDQIGIFHAALAQVFFVLLCVIAVLTNRGWRRGERVEGEEAGAGLARQRFGVRQSSGAFSKATTLPKAPEDWRSPKPAGLPDGFREDARLLRVLSLATVLLSFGQLILGASMRHQHAGLAIPDFPLAYGKIWPAMNAAAVESYNQHRLEITADNPITGFQIGLQMAHRIVALLILGGVAACAWAARSKLGRQHLVSWLALGWLGLVVAQALLGAATIWSNKAADIATAHVLVGALSLALGTVLSMAADVSLGTAREPEAAAPTASRAATAQELTSTGVLRHPALREEFH